MRPGRCTDALADRPLADALDWLPISTTISGRRLPCGAISVRPGRSRTSGPVARLKIPVRIVQTSPPSPIQTTRKEITMSSRREAWLCGLRDADDKQETELITIERDANGCARVIELTNGRAHYLHPADDHQPQHSRRGRRHESHLCPSFSRAGGRGRELQEARKRESTPDSASSTFNDLRTRVGQDGYP